MHNAHLLEGCDDNLKQCFAQMRKEPKALKRFTLKQGKKSRKHLKKRYVLEERSDNGSNSDK